MTLKIFAKNTSPLFSLVIVCIVVFMRVNGSGVFVRPGYPVCYTSPSLNLENVDGYSYCGASDSRDLWCGLDHECCWNDNGMPSCCTKRSSFSTGEIAGFVIGSVAAAGILITVVYVIANKFCILRSPNQ